MSKRRMGLDLVHARLSIKNENTPEFFTMEEFDTFPEFIERHKHLISEIVDIDSIFTICIFSEEEDKQDYERWWGVEENKIVMAGKVDDMGEKISEIEKHNGLEKMHKFQEELSMFKQHGAGRMTYHRIEYADSYTKLPVLYWTEIGYQRKGMECKFYEIFENCKLYFKKEDVLRASTYLSLNDPQRPNIKNEFTKEFIDNFIEGESIFFASW